MPSTVKAMIWVFLEKEKKLKNQRKSLGPEHNTCHGTRTFLSDKISLTTTLKLH